MNLHKSLKAQIQSENPEPTRSELNYTCPNCGGPAEMETYWSTSPDRPGLKVLKRQIFCGKRPKRFSRGHEAGCPVVTEELACEPIVAESRPKLVLVNRQGPPEGTSETIMMSSKEDGKHPQETIETSTPSRGRLPAELRSQILDMSAEGMTPEEIAHRIGRSSTAVRKVLAVEESLPETPASNNGVDLDSVIDFLAELPADATQEIMQLAQLQRERSQLRSSLEMRLKDLKKKV